ncbi:Chemotaxis protein [Desulfonema limicola]|uniref:Chemotaxis protein CheA n=1 Tax=Desulfonema limicola TaxID=45656 RepID=A0A975BA74_9BACT|nr:chemotaxis protein CheA [Desulfonema limicola]QTA81591.1 Chemotaxis protein [Desulfonema limicola]
MNEHKLIYKEEAYELLAELESSLIELENSPDDEDLIAQVFRSMHTIKGSGAMFGYDNIAAFTHEIETVYDLVRDSKIKVTRDLLKLTLSACDHIKKMVDEDDIDESFERELVSAFQKMIPGNPGTFDSRKPELPDISSYDNYEQIYRIRFQPDRDLFHTGTNPAVLLNELRSLGQCQIVAHQKNIPVLSEMDPELCYLHWDIIISSSQGLQAIRDVFIFAEDYCKLDIQVVYHEKFPSDSPEHKKIGQILVERGDVSAEEIEKVLQGHKRVGEMLIDARSIDPETLESALKEQQHLREISRKRENITNSSSIRVPAEKLDGLVNLVGELVTVQARLTRMASIEKNTELTAIAEAVEYLSAELRDHTMNIRMLPVGNTFRKFKRLIFDLSSELNKEITVITEGEETELDKNVLDQLNDPLMHIIRNTIDHGIETPEVRIAKGKPRQGTIRLSAEYSGSDVLIMISGDGAGLNTQAIRAKALEKKLISPDAQLSEKDIHALIFAPGFSTAKQISGVSGRGVGMDVVRRRIESLRGSIDIKSEKDKGMSVTLKLPLTLAIADGLLIRLGTGYYVLPLLAVEECLELKRHEADKARERKIIQFRKELISYISLHEMFHIKDELPEIEKVVVINTHGKRVGFGVDKVLGQHQTVIKNLGYFYKDVKTMSGATILGDGTVALILDVNRIIMSLENNSN